MHIMCIEETMCIMSHSLGIKWVPSVCYDAMTSSKNNTTEEQANNWTFGDPCPDCGATIIRYTETITRRLTPDGDGRVTDAGILHAAGEEVVCDECDRFLGTEVEAETV